MSQIEVEPALVAEFGQVQANQAGVGALSEAALAATSAALVPTFGLVGANFIAALQRAHANYFAQIDEISAARTRLAATAANCATAYESQDLSSAHNLIKDR